MAVSVITFSELWFGIELEVDAACARQRRRWIEKLFRRLEIVPVDSRVARAHARIWAQLTASGQIIGPHDLIDAATALRRRWAVATFNAREFRHVRVHEPRQAIRPRSTARRLLPKDEVAMTRLSLDPLRLGALATLRFLPDRERDQRKGAKTPRRKERSVNGS